ncbi:dehydrodolichyl diphosphate synthase complex subunit NUS1 [Sergentomyia squamirostris]
MSTSILYKVAWLLLHLLFTFVETVIFYRNFLLRKFKKYWKSLKAEHGTQSAAEYIKLHREYLDKIPNHMAVILGLEEPHFETLTNIIYWAMASEISYISIYDHKELLQAQQNDLREFVLSRKITPGHVIFPSSHETANGNGFKNQIRVQILSRADGKQTIGDLCRTLSQEVQQGKLQIDQIDVEFVNRRLSDLTGRIPDPDIAIYTGKFCCTYGFLPWQSRLTEFIPMESQKHFSLDDYLSILYKYAKKEQRFGK